MPQIGLGTGGLALEETKNIVKLALKLGYRSLDLAREYKNEHLVGELFAESLEDESMPLRAEVFVESKVWPTELGFFPTSEAILASLEDLKTNKCGYVIDWWHNDLIKRNVIKMYWAYPALTEQGSHNGLLNSTISSKSCFLIHIHIYI
jgi:diketogulonate reductase-like aldo/keto reductase